ncbi:hypothetical protein [Virgibacillus sp. CBA3643]|uniref:hypothetical protein n=1 Tax=Virgibacillus sp. CBA3643 TaxID=2942278 RepID=UPI0035A29ACF
MENSFFRTMVEEKGIIFNSFEVEVNGMVHMMDVEQIIELIESAPDHETKEIKDKFSQIDFYNGDLMDFIKFLAKSFIKTNY